MQVFIYVDSEKWMVGTRGSGCFTRVSRPSGLPKWGTPLYYRTEYWSESFTFVIKSRMHGKAEAWIASFRYIYTDSQLRTVMSPSNSRALRKEFRIVDVFACVRFIARNDSDTPWWKLWSIVGCNGANKSLVPMPAYTVERSFYAEVGTSVWQTQVIQSCGDRWRFRAGFIFLSRSLLLCFDYFHLQNGNT